MTLSEAAVRQQQRVLAERAEREQREQDAHLARKGRLSRAALRYAEAWQRQSGLDEAWEELAFEALAYWGDDC